MVKNFQDKYLSQHPKLDFIQKVIRYRANEQFINIILGFGKDPTHLKFTQMGDLNQSVNCYLIKLEGLDGGFFALYRWVLCALAYANKFGFLPVVEYANCFYEENEKVNDTTNPFEYYFKQPSNITLEEAYMSSNVFHFERAHLRWIEAEFNMLDENLICGYEVTENYLEALAQIAKEYIHLNAVTEKVIYQNGIYQKTQKMKTLGVHIRGTDYSLALDFHPVMAQIEEYFVQIEKALHYYSFDQIFLATDDRGILETFIKKFQNKLIFYSDVNRTKEMKNIAFVSNDRKNNRYLNGLEVLRDMYTLANCDGLIAGLSQVSFAARITKKSFHQHYYYLKIIDKGIINP